MIENMLMIYVEVRDQLQALGILTSDQIELLRGLLQSLPLEGLPAAWSVYRVAWKV